MIAAHARLDDARAIVDLAAGEPSVRSRLRFLADLDADLDDNERRWIACDPRHRHEIEVALAELQ